MRRRRLSDEMLEIAERAAAIERESVRLLERAIRAEDRVRSLEQRLRAAGL